MPRIVLLFFILPRLTVSPDQAPGHRPAQIFRRLIWNAPNDDQQLLDIARFVRQLIQLGYSGDGHVADELQMTGTDPATHEASVIFEHTRIYVQPSYDVVNPYGDDRETAVNTVWIVDLCTDTVTHVDRSSRRSLALHELLDSAPTLAMFRFTGPAITSFDKPSINANEPSWRPDVSVNPRTRAFAHRILRDFDFQWRHVLRSDYNYATLRVLARAVLCLSTFKFRIHEITKTRYGRKKHFVSPSKLPGWKPLATDTIPIGDVNVVICQSLQDGLSKIRAHLRQSAVLKGANEPVTPSYRPFSMLLSVKGIALCRITPAGDVETSAPEPLFNGDSEAAPLSDLALDQLLWATSTRSSDAVDTPSLTTLPVEIQDAILGYCSDNPVAGAMLGCQLNIGSSFTWFHGNRPVELKPYYEARDPGPPIESQIWFGDHMSGVAYQEVA